MPDKFEKFIAKNRDQFDVHEPDPGIWKKVERKIRPKRRLDWRIMLIRAAGVAAIFVVSFFINEFIHRLGQDRPLAEKSGKQRKEIVIPELREAEAYYAGIINEKLEEMRPIISGCPDLEEELQLDFSELDSIYLELKNDLRDNIANQEVITAIIENYRLKIEILEEMLLELDSENDVCIPNTDEYAL